MSRIKEEKDCCGCAACANICPKKCISLGINEYGVRIPFIDSNKCVNCGLCEKVCPINNFRHKNRPTKCYAGWRKDILIQQDCSSGGIATLIAEEYFERGWSVYGTTFTREDGTCLRHFKTIFDIEQSRGSKYVQSEMGDIFKSIEKEVALNHRIVVFGTSCQISAIKAFLSIKKSYDLSNILFVDFLCHGVSPRTYLDNEINELEAKYSKRVDTISFRSNKKDRNYYFCLYDKDGLFYRKKAEYQRYFYMFLHSIGVRESCMHCKFKTLERVGDLTLGDFIGLGKDKPFQHNQNKMVNPSLVLINTLKGDDALGLIRNKVNLWERGIEEAVIGGPSLRGNMKNNVCRVFFRKLYPKLGYYTSANIVTFFPILFEHINNCKDYLISYCKRKIKGIIYR